MSSTRQIVSISLPPQVLRAMKADAKKGGFASMSEYVRDLVREKERAKLAKEFKAMSRDFDRGGKKHWSRRTSLDGLE